MPRTKVDQETAQIGAATPGRNDRWRPARVRNEYNQYIARRVVHSPFDDVVGRLLATRTRSEILAILGNRVGWRAVHWWRDTGRRPPQWVLDRLAAVIQADADALIAELRTVEAQPDPETRSEASRKLARKLNERLRRKKAGEDAPGP